MVHRLWDRWKLIAHKIGVFQSRLLLNVFYFVIVLPFGIGVKLFSDPLHIKHKPGSNWGRKLDESSIADRAKKQF